MLCLVNGSGLADVVGEFYFIEKVIKKTVHSFILLCDGDYGGSDQSKASKQFEGE